MSVNNTNPSSFFGGTWVSWGSGRVPVGVNTSDANFNTVEKTGGASSNSHTPRGTVNGTVLTVNQIPVHNHAQYVTVDTAAGSAIRIDYVSDARGAAGQIYPQGAVTGNAGGGQAHSHGFTGTATNISTLQPYITCYMWKRTA